MFTYGHKIYKALSDHLDMDVISHSSQMVTHLPSIETMVISSLVPKKVYMFFSDDITRHVKLLILTTDH